MAKMSPEDKLAAVQRYVNGNESSRMVAANFDISHRYLLSLVKQYEHNGIEAFVRRYTDYTKAFKLDVLNYMAEHGTSFNETLRSLTLRVLHRYRIGKVNSTLRRCPFSQRKRGVHP